MSTWFKYFYDHHERQIAELKAIADGYASPELIDDGQHSAPSKRIVAKLPDYEREVHRRDHKWRN